MTSSAVGEGANEAVLLQSIVDHAQRVDVDGRVVSELPPTIDLALA